MSCFVLSFEMEIQIVDAFSQNVTQSSASTPAPEYGIHLIKNPWLGNSQSKQCVHGRFKNPQYWYLRFWLRRQRRCGQRACNHRVSGSAETWVRVCKGWRLQGPVLCSTRIWAGQVGDGKAQIKDRSLGACILNTADSKAKQRLGNAVFKMEMTLGLEVELSVNAVIKIVIRRLVITFAPAGRLYLYDRCLGSNQSFQMNLFWYFRRSLRVKSRWF